MSAIRDIMEAPDPSPEDMQAARQALGSPFPRDIASAPQLAEKMVALAIEKAKRAGFHQGRDAAAAKAEQIYRSDLYEAAVAREIAAAIRALEPPNAGDEGERG